RISISIHPHNRRFRSHLPGHQRSWLGHLARLHETVAHPSRLAKPRLAVGSNPGRLYPAGDVIPLPQSDDGQAERRPTHLHRSIPSGKIIRRLEEESHTLGTSERVPRRTNSFRKLFVPRPDTYGLAWFSLTEVRCL